VIIAASLSMFAPPKPNQLYWSANDNAGKIPADVQTLVKHNRDEILSGKLQVPNVPMGQ
jgi:hypothetical protein